MTSPRWQRSIGAPCAEIKPRPSISPASRFRTISHPTCSVIFRKRRLANVSSIWGAARRSIARSANAPASTTSASITTTRMPRLLGDAHALPFPDRSFDFLISIAVLEHIRYPAVMLAEAYRVLRPGAPLIGTVSFQEPFHEISYHHHSHVAVWSGLRHAGFEVLHIAPGWDGLTAHAQMALLPGFPRFAIQLATAPLRLLHRITWGFLSTFRPGWDKLRRRQIAAGAFVFIGRRISSA